MSWVFWCHRNAQIFTNCALISGESMWKLVRLIVTRQHGIIRVWKSHHHGSRWMGLSISHQLTAFNLQCCACTWKTLLPTMDRAVANLAKIICSNRQMRLAQIISIFNTGETKYTFNRLVQLSSTSIGHKNRMDLLTSWWRDTVTHIGCC